MRKYLGFAVAAVLMASVSLLASGVAGAAAPVVSIDPTPTASYTTAEVTGTVTPADNETYYYAQYSTDPENEGWISTEYQGPLAPSGTSQSVSVTIVGLLPGIEYETRLVAENFVDPAVFSSEPNPRFTTEPVGSPVVTIDPVTAFTGTTAHFSGTVDPDAPVGNPGAFDVDWRFECSPSCPGLDGGTVSAAEGEREVEADASGLEPNTTYEVELIAENDGGSVSTGPVGFETDPMAPEVLALYSGHLGTQTATLAASVNPKNSSVTYRFEWGTDTSYGNLAPGSPQVLAPDDNAFHVVTAPLTGLVDGTTYHYRLVATNSDNEVAEGADRTFTTLESADPPSPCPNADIQAEQDSTDLPDCRAYEMVSPPDKVSGVLQGANEFTVPRAAESGDALSWTELAASDVQASSSLFSQYYSARIEGAWTTAGINPPLDVSPEVPSRASIKWLSPDLSKVVVSTRARLTENAVDHVSLYLRDIKAGTYELLNVSEIPFTPPYSDSESGSYFFNAANDDMSHIAFRTVRTLTADGQPQGSTGLYEWADGHVSLVGQIPPPGSASCGDSGPACEAIAEAYAGAGAAFTNTAQGAYAGRNPISADGTRIYFGAGNAFGSEAIFRRDDSKTTTLVSGSERSGDDPTVPVPGKFFAANADGSIMLFSSEGWLTDSSPSGGPGAHLYRYDANAPLGSRLTDLTTSDPTGARILGEVGTSEDVSRIYFAARGTLTADAPENGVHLYLWTEGQGLTFIASLDPLDTRVWGTSRAGHYDADTQYFRDARVTPDGEHLVFASVATLTSHDNHGYRQIYRYDAGFKELTCVSCSSGIAASSASAELLPTNDTSVLLHQQAPFLPRNLSDDGSRVFFDTPEALVKGDSNGQTDVYAWADGAVHLLSSGRSSAPSYFLDASSSGKDVFFTTRQSLVGFDRDRLSDAYDVRVGGGFPEPPPSPICEGDSCQPPPVVPVDPSPASATFKGVESHKARRGCRKPNRRIKRGGKVRCVKPKRRSSRKGSDNRRAHR